MTPFQIFIKKKKQKRNFHSDGMGERLGLVFFELFFIDTLEFEIFIIANFKDTDSSVGNERLTFNFRIFCL